MIWSLITEVLQKHIPAKDGKLGFVDAEESTFLWAKQMGYDGEKLSKPSRIDGNLEIFNYLNGDVIHYKVVDEGTRRVAGNQRENSAPILGKQR